MSIIQIEHQDVFCSVVMPVHNGERFLREAIDSVLDQTFKNFELIIVNDNSTDGSKDIINSYLDSRIICIDNDSNIGPFASYNIGIKKSSGKFIAFSDQDDFNEKNRLSEQISFLSSNTSKICASNFNIINESNELITTTSIENINETLNEKIIYKPFVFHNPTVMIEKELFYEFGMFDETLRIGADYKFYLNLSLHEKLQLVSKPLYNWRFHNDSYTYVTKTKSYRVQEEISLNFLSENRLFFNVREIEKYKSLIYYYCDSLLKSFYASLVFLLKNGLDIKILQNFIKLLFVGPIVKFLRHFNLFYKIKQYIMR